MLGKTFLFRSSVGASELFYNSGLTNIVPPIVCDEVYFPTFAHSKFVRCEMQA